MQDLLKPHFYMRFFRKGGLARFCVSMGTAMDLLRLSSLLT